ncbi:MAG: hypothetical protein O3A78_13490 [Nitrospinae bacterium]|nr:hypothetical protein [Nitrospinota bacterium]
MSFIIKILEPRFSVLLLKMASGIALLGSVALILWFWRGGIPSGNTSGVWAALANDFAEGVFYRPVFDDTGYGGTRYMPLFFVLYGILISYFNDPVLSGLLLSLSTIVFLDWGSYVLLRQLGIKKNFALAFTFLVHASIAFQLLTLEFRGDFLAAGLNVWGIVFALKHLRTNSRGHLTLSAVFFTGAIFTKFTTIGGLVTIAFLFLIQKKKSSAITLTGLTAVTTLGLLFGVNEWSHGKALASFQACALGGFNLTYALKTPLWFLTVIVQDPFFLALLGLAIYLVTMTLTAQCKSFITLYFCFTLVSTFLIFSSPGTDSNHLIDLLIACILVTASQFQTNQKFSSAYNLYFLFTVIGILFMWIPGTLSIKDHIESVGRPTRTTIQTLAEKLGPENKNILSENPLVPLLMGQRPFVLDAFSLRLLAQKSPVVHEDFIRRLKDQFFEAIILLDWSGAPLDQLEDAMEKHSSLGVDRFYGEVHFPPGFLDLMKKHYALSFVERPFVIYKPKKMPPNQNIKISIENN